MELIQMTQDLEGIVQDISRAREERIILSTQCTEIRHQNEVLATQSNSLRQSTNQQDLRLAEANAKAREQDLAMKALGADIITAREA